MNKSEIWQSALENLKITLSPANFSTWFPQTFIVNFSQKEKNRQIVEIGCPNLFVRNEIENRYYSLIKETLDQITTQNNNLVFIVKQKKKPKDKESTSQNQPLFESRATEEKTETEAEIKIDERTAEKAKQVGLRPDFIFDTFAVSSTNQMAHAAATAVAKTPGKAYNPLFLYGGVGVGKTHLMQAVAHEVLKINPEAKIVYCTGEEFTNEIVNAIRRKNTDEFKEKYRSAQILMVDDIQFIAGKERAQEEFFHTFNSIWQVGGQVILTSDQPPDKIKQLEDRLRSRFEGGLTIDIQEPDFELRAAILLIKAQQRHVKLPMDVAQLIASNITSTRKLEGFLTRVITEAETKKEPLTPEFTRALLGQTSENNIPQRLVKPKEIIKTVADYFGLKISDLTGPRRLKTIALPRQVLMYLLRNELEAPFMEIGRLLGGRDHTTILYGVGKITNNLATSEQLRVDIAGIKKRLYE